MMAIMNAITMISAALIARVTICFQISFRSRVSNLCSRSRRSDAMVRTSSLSERMYNGVRMLVRGGDHRFFKSFICKNLEFRIRLIDRSCDAKTFKKTAGRRAGGQAGGRAAGQQVVPRQSQIPPTSRNRTIEKAATDNRCDLFLSSSARGENRTHTPLRGRDFESRASTSSTTRAGDEL